MIRFNPRTASAVLLCLALLAPSLVHAQDLALKRKTKSDIVAGSSSATKSLSRVFAKTPGPVPNSISVSPIVNGGFETGSFSPWAIDGTAPPPVVSNTQAHTGTYSAFIGSAAGTKEADGDSSFYQTIDVPADGGVLSFWYFPHTTDNIEFDYQDAYIASADGQTVLASIMHVCQDDQAWIDVTYDMAAFAGQTVSIKFLVHEDGSSDETNMFIDDVNLAPATTAGQLVISEFRLSGSGGAGDEFIELYNATNTPLTVKSLDGSGGLGVAASDGILRCTVADNTVIPARGHFLCANSTGYSLTPYAVPDATYQADINDARGIALFNSSTNFSFATRLDAAGPNNEENTLYREGDGTGGLSNGTNLEYSVVRKLTSGTPQDTNDNAADFQIVSPRASAVVGSQSSNPFVLGAPGPESLNSPVNRSDKIKASLVNPCVTNANDPNRVRVTGSYTDNLTSSQPDDFTASYALGYLEIRRVFSNTTRGNVTRLRFRIVDITTLPAPTGTADLRVLTSPTITGITTCNGTTTVEGLTLEQPATQANGGGLNSTVSAGSFSLRSPLAAGDSVAVNFRLGVVQPGSFHFYVIVEALP
ncbi:MAG: hypothetical protein QOE33_684 [Acidobacteriota bacterium]|nr:hypothetical protein [Acidobacteriota bacterium]